MARQSGAGWPAVQYRCRTDLRIFLKRAAAAAAAAAAMGILGACYAARVTGDPAGVVPESFALGMGAFKNLSGGRVVIRAIRVERDTRCEVNVLCNQMPGNATVVLGVRQDAGSEHVLSLNTHEAPREGEVAVGRLVLDSLLPHPPVTKDTIPQAHYVAFITFIGRTTP